jgi:hypothetical protein
VQSDPKFAALASVVPFGEIIVNAAQAHGVDPFVLAAIATVVSDGNPFANPTPDHRGLLGIQSANGAITWDPSQNADMAAAQIATLGTTTQDLPALLSQYYRGAAQDIADQSVSDFVNAVTATTDALRARFSGPATPQVSQPLLLAGSGSAFTISDRYGSDWWTQALDWYATWGGAVGGWQPDPLGYWCLARGYAPGDRLRLIANGVSIDCTVGAHAGELGLPGLGDNSLGLTRQAFDALGLGNANGVSIYHLGPASGQRSASATRIGAGAAAYYASGYDRAWWDRTLQLHVGWGNSVGNWSLDPNGFYCVNPDYRPGTRLRLVANGLTLDCTVGDSVQSFDEAMWRSRWAVEMSWDTFQALGLAGSNVVQVFVVR